jgi:hypothetical protein
MRDAFDNTVTTASTEALALLDQAIDLHAHAWPGALEAAEAATEADPGLALGHALQG